MKSNGKIIKTMQECNKTNHIQACKQYVFFENRISPMGAAGVWTWNDETPKCSIVPRQTGLITFCKKAFRPTSYWKSFDSFENENFKTKDTRITPLKNV